MSKRKVHRLPWSEPVRPGVPELSSEHAIALSLGDPWGHAVAIAARAAARSPEVSHFDPRSGLFSDGPLRGASIAELEAGAAPVLLPVVVESGTGRVVCDDPAALAATLLGADSRDRARARAIRTELLDAVYSLGAVDDQAEYERQHADLEANLRAVDGELRDRRFLAGADVGLADVLLFCFSVRFEAVYYELYKASLGSLEDFPAVADHARDLFERPEFYETTDFAAVKAQHYLNEPVLNPRSIVPAGGIFDLDAPHFRDELDGARDRGDRGIEEQPDRDRGAGEWVRPLSRHRHWIRADGSGTYPAKAGRYHLYAPQNCPWSHRALLGRAVKGLADVVDASIVYFRRDPDRGWQFNPAVPGCTPDREYGHRYVAELYESIGSSERSVPVLWDTETRTVVSNESAEILRMFNDAFGDLAGADLDLYPPAHRDEIDRVNELVYQRINNGAYKAGFANSQLAYERACARYFRALDWVEDRLETADWLARSERPTEADLRLFPTVFRHDAVYYARFKLNVRRIADYPRLSAWLDRMMRVPGVAEASNLDHARNGYFGRTGNEIVPAGPVPLSLSPKDFSRDVWLNRPPA